MAPTAPTTQIPLLPREPLAIKDQQVLIDRLPPDEEIPSPPPTRDLIDSIRAWGVLDPLLVRAVGGGVDYGHHENLLAGRRRLKAVRFLREEAKADLARATVAVAAGQEAGKVINLGDDPVYRAAYERMKEWQRVPVRVVSDPEGTASDPTGPVLALLSNAVRRDNPISDLAMLERLLGRAEAREQGERQALTEISRVTGLSVGSIKQRLRLRKLSASLRALFNAGRLSYTVALEASKIPGPAQDRLLAALEPGKALTLDDVKAARKGDVDTVRQVSLGDIFPDDDAPFVPSERPLRERADSLVAQLRGTRLPLCQEAASLIEELSR